jgi:hypothetical protein
VTAVPEDEPKNEPGDGLFPKTVMINADGWFLPPNTFMVTSSVADNPGGGIVGHDQLVPTEWTT